MDRTSKIELTNMCPVYNDTCILVQEKLGLKEKYRGGLVFLGGHIEPNESLLDTVVREIKEETGLTINHRWRSAKNRIRRNSNAEILRQRKCFC